MALGILVAGGAIVAWSLRSDDANATNGAGGAHVIEAPPL